MARKHKPRSKPNDDAGSEFVQLDALLLHRLRLGACVLLADTDRLSFSRLKQALDATDGNLGAHLRKLEEAAYVQAEKRFDGRTPVTWYTLTGTGRNALRDYLDAMRALADRAGGS